MQSQESVDIFLDDELNHHHWNSPKSLIDTFIPGQRYGPKMLIKTESSLVQGIANKSNDQAPEFNFLCCDVSREIQMKIKPQPPRLQFTLARYFDSYHHHNLHVNQS